MTTKTPRQELDEITQLMRRYADDGLAVAYLAHIIGEAELVGYRAGITERGRMTADQMPANNYHRIGQK